jgi:hypothetical protein
MITIICSQALNSLATKLKGAIMKIDGKTYDKPNAKYIVFPRQDGNIVFKATAILDYGEFDSLIKKPEAPKIMKRGETTAKPNYEDKGYQDLLDEWVNKKTEWLFLKTIEGTAGLKWDTVDMNDPNTWGNYMAEMKSCLTDMEIARLLFLVNEVNGLDQSKIDEATQSFLASQAAR